MREPIRIELPTIYGMKTVNAYLFLDPVPTLIDAGEKTPASWEALTTALAKHQLKIADIQRIIITHAHVDHMGMAGKIAAHSNAEVWVNEYCYPWAVQKEAMWDRRVQLMGQLLPESVSGTPGNFKQMILAFMENVKNHWDNIPEEKLHVFPMEGQLNFGGGDWEVIYVPGHANMQTCFYQREHKWLIAADMLLRITPTAVMDASIDDPKVRDRGLSQLLESYKKMEVLDIDTVFPGHYEPFGDHRSVIKTQVDRIHSRIQESYDLIKGGTSDFMDILNIMYKNRVSMPAMSMLLGYLDVLEEQGKIEVKDVNGKKGFFLMKES